jgi:hypothetical protein
MTMRECVSFWRLWRNRTLLTQLADDAVSARMDKAAHALQTPSVSKQTKPDDLLGNGRRK